jgi:hypothetical protein
LDLISISYLILRDFNTHKGVILLFTVTFKSSNQIARSDGYEYR